MGCKPSCFNNISNNNNTIEFNYNGDNSQTKIKESTTVVSEKTLLDIMNKKSSLLKSSNNNYKYYYEIIELLNKYRARHNVPPLNIDSEINIIAQSHSDKIARENFIEISNNKYKNSELGEIIFQFSENDSLQHIISSFYEQEIIKYNYKSKAPNPSNFTQIIWKNSKYIGIGCSKTRDNNIYIVINFYPPGNINNEFLLNVFPPTDDDKKSNISSNNSDIKINFLEELLNNNNEYREKHGVPLLILNPSLTTKANEYANLMVENNCIMNKEIEYMGEKCGKNIFIKKCQNYDWKIVCDEWYKEINEYNFIDMKKNNKEKCKNFTQLIWKETKEVGFGWAHSNTGNLCVVGVYYPCGNIEGEYKENVLPLME